MHGIIITSTEQGGGGGGVQPCIHLEIYVYALLITLFLSLNRAFFVKVQ